MMFRFYGWKFHVFSMCVGGVLKEKMPGEVWMLKMLLNVRVIVVFFTSCG